MQNPEIEPALLAIGFEADSTTVGTRSAVLAKALEVYPNPNLGTFTIILPPDQVNTQEVIIELFNVSGQLAFRQNYQALASLNIHATSLATGTYTLRTSIAKKEYVQHITIK